MGKNATGQNLMLWMSTKCASCGGKKKDLSYGGGGLLKLCINQKACFRLVAQESIKKTAVHPFLLLPLKRALTSLEGMQVQAALEV